MPKRATIGWVLDGKHYRGQDPRQFTDFSEADFRAYQAGTMSKTEYLERNKARQVLGIDGSEPSPGPLTLRDWAPGMGMHEIVEIITPLPGDTQITQVIHALRHDESWVLKLIAGELKRYRYRPSLKQIRDMARAAYDAKRHMELCLDCSSDVEDLDLKRRRKRVIYE